MIKYQTDLRLLKSKREVPDEARCWIRICKPISTSLFATYFIFETSIRQYENIVLACGFYTPYAWFPCYLTENNEIALFAGLGPRDGINSFSTGAQPVATQSSSKAHKASKSSQSPGSGRNVAGSSSTADGLAQNYAVAMQECQCKVKEDYLIVGQQTPCRAQGRCKERFEKPVNSKTKYCDACRNSGIATPMESLPERQLFGQRPPAPDLYRPPPSPVAHRPPAPESHWEQPRPPPPYTPLPALPLPPPPPRPPRPPPLPVRVNVDPNIGALRIEDPIRPVSRGQDRSPQSPYFPPPPPPASHRLRVQTSLPNLSQHGLKSPALSPRLRSPAPVSAAATFGPGVTPGPNSSTESKPFWQNALSEAKYFAGGLIPPPTESTKHYTVLRHSSPLIFYRGPSTSVEISIFSAPDYPLPPDRTIWLQQRGFSGDSGMKIKAFFGSTDDWLNVTPSVPVQPSEVEKDLERGWRRDIDKAAKRFLKDKGPKKAHVPRETHVVRIPEASEDGYFRLHLCAGGPPEIPNPSSDPPPTTSKRKVLCSSPIFRIASTSTDSSIFRGASLSTLPLEVGAFVGSKVILARADPILAPIQAGYERVSPGLVKETVATLTYEVATDKVNENAALRQEKTSYISSSRSISASVSPDVNTIGPDSGPLPPFPLKFAGVVHRGTGKSTAELGIPTANLLRTAPESARYSLRGVYAGWACLLPPKDNPPAWQPPTWYPAVISAGPLPQSRPQIAPEPQVTVHLLHEFPTHFLGTEIKVIAMGYLRPSLHFSAPLEDKLVAFSQDVHLVTACLNGPGRKEGWGPDAAAVLLRQRKSERGMGERFLDAKEKVARKVPSVPLHKVGIRGLDPEAKDRMHGKGGYWVKR
ncbi:hypothetical protein QBC40DRAFT_347446 [Triangularia verruculosa]|uniref:Riboflavin kinase n=1 Tax=Triangularia verruculosa TaxID=2587418 RepID=A0AAN7AYF8_9PEZI|nr:hypothetical protein QBC40DRAFT_347446 [Triangularia verruculosa]